jgi:RNA polymerase sigma factor (TIGR02999 family)
VTWQNRAHFLAVAAHVMRHILVDYARSHRTMKRGSGERALPLDEAVLFAVERPDDMVALDDALASLASVDPRKSRIVEVRYFGGLSSEETAEVMGISVATVRRELRMAEAWLYREVSKR